MRKYKDKDFAPVSYCSTVRLTEKTYKEMYSKCRIRKDLPKEEGFVYVLIPYERIAADAVIEIWGVDKNDTQRYKTAYIKAANETLRQSTEGMLERLQKSNMTDEQKTKIEKVVSIVTAYQNKLKEKNITMPAPFNPALPQQASVPAKDSQSVLSENGKKAKSELDKLLKTQPKEIKQNTPVKTTNANSQKSEPKYTENTAIVATDNIRNDEDKTHNNTAINVAENKPEIIADIIEEDSEVDNGIVDNAKNKEAINDDPFAIEVEMTVKESSNKKSESFSFDIETVNLDEEEKTDERKDEYKAAEKPSVPDFSLGLTIDDLIGNKEAEAEIEEITFVSDTESDEAFPDDYFDEYLKESERGEDTTNVIEEKVSDNDDIPVNTQEVSVDEEDDDDIYSAMFGKKID